MLNSTTCLYFNLSEALDLRGRLDNAAATESATYPVLFEHLGVAICKVLAVLEVVYTLNAVALLEVVLHDAGLHGAHPRLPDVLVTSLLLRYGYTPRSEHIICISGR